MGHKAIIKKTEANTNAKFLFEGIFKFVILSNFLINYEKLCIGGSDYLGNVLKGVMSFSGEIDLHPTTFATGSWSLKNLEKDNTLNKVVNKPKTIFDFPEDFISSEKDALKKIERQLAEYSFLWK